MNKIPTHKIPQDFQAEMAFLRYFSKDVQVAPTVNYAHRDEYYLFLFIDSGEGKMLIDFKEYKVKGTAVQCILPGQVHLPTNEVKADGWVLAVDSAFIKNNYKEVFKKAPLINGSLELSDSEKEELQNCASILSERLKPDRQHIGQSIAQDLLSSCIGMIAEIYQKALPSCINNRYADITYRFKSLVSEKHCYLKRPSQYASELNISPVYLNEAVKKTTGMSAGDCIRDEIIIQAKRLLFYTKMSVKEIARELGYEDWAYFTRLFTKATTLSPVHFRKQYLK